VSLWWLDSFRENPRARRSKHLRVVVRVFVGLQPAKNRNSSVGMGLAPIRFGSHVVGNRMGASPIPTDWRTPTTTREEQMAIRYSRWFVFSNLLALLALVGCTARSEGTAPTTRPVTRIAGSTATPSPANKESTVTFTLAGGANGSYTVHAAVPTSKLRHGHREFTIDVEHAGASVFFVFYGYNGPGTYTLALVLNGGDMHIALGKNTESWDLSLQPQARCTLTIQSDIPTQSAGLDRMKGFFSCPHLFSSTPAHPQKPVSVSDGTFDVAILVES
jgi:hypothetical protein